MSAERPFRWRCGDVPLSQTAERHTTHRCTGLVGGGDVCGGCWISKTQWCRVSCVCFSQLTHKRGAPPGMELFVVRLMILVCESTSHLPKVEAVVRLVWHG